MGEQSGGTHKMHHQSGVSSPTKQWLASCMATMVAWQLADSKQLKQVNKMEGPKKLEHQIEMHALLPSKITIEVTP